MGYLEFAMGVAFMTGPVIGGWLAQKYDFSAPFLFACTVIIVLTPLLWWLSHNSV